MLLPESSGIGVDHEAPRPRGFDYAVLEAVGAQLVDAGRLEAAEQQLPYAHVDLSEALTLWQHGHRRPAVGRVAVDERGGPNAAHDSVATNSGVSRDGSTSHNAASSPSRALW